RRATRRQRLASTRDSAGGGAVPAEVDLGQLLQSLVVGPEVRRQPFTGLLQHGGVLAAVEQMRQLLRAVGRHPEKLRDTVERGVRVGEHVLGPEEQELLPGEELEPTLQVLCIPAAGQIRPNAELEAV